MWCIQRTQYWTSPQILGTGHFRTAQVVAWDYSGDALTQPRSISPRHLSSGVASHTGKEEINSMQRGLWLLETPQVPATLSQGYQAQQPQVNISCSNSYFRPPQYFLAMSFALYFMWKKSICVLSRLKPNAKTSERSNTTEDAAAAACAHATMGSLPCSRCWLAPKELVFGETLW